MSALEPPSQQSQFSRTLRECRQLYVSSGELCALEFPHLLSQSGESFIQLMNDLHKALVLKVYFSVTEADRRWSKAERQLAQELFHHLWDQWLHNEKLKAVAKQAAIQSQQLKWYSIVRPFDRIEPLRERVGNLETIVMRLANMVARADGRLLSSEAAMIQSIQDELQQHLRPIPVDGPSPHETTDRLGSQAIQDLRREAAEIGSATRAPLKTSSQPTLRARADSTVRTGVEDQSAPAESVAPRLSLEASLAELDALIGLDRVKHEVRTLTNFLRLQQRRAQAGLPETQVSLHMVFHGNPGTGKTSVARILGKIFGAMGILAKGHLVETDRSGIVAEYAGQTGPKTNAKIDEALDGVLFIDEAYSLVSEAGEDPFGHEAVQVLLKRAEDDRRRLVVILAGYPDRMAALLTSNPGLSSRFGRQLSFDDYTPLELARIFGAMCDHNHYALTTRARLRALRGFSWWYERRDQHFGNGRSVRNLFEQAVRRLANRIAHVEELTADQLSLLEADDLEFAEVPQQVFAEPADGQLRVRIVCPGCRHAKAVPTKFLGQEVRCPKCRREFAADWCELVPPSRRLS